MLGLIKCTMFICMDVYGCSCWGSDGSLNPNGWRVVWRWWRPSAGTREREERRGLMEWKESNNCHISLHICARGSKNSEEGGVSTAGNYSHCGETLLQEFHSPSLSLCLSVPPPQATVLRQLILHFSFGDLLSHRGGRLSLSSDTVQLVWDTVTQNPHLSHFLKDAPGLKKIYIYNSCIYIGASGDTLLEGMRSHHSALHWLAACFWICFWDDTDDCLSRLSTASLALTHISDLWGNYSAARPLACSRRRLLQCLSPRRGPEAPERSAWGYRDSWPSEVPSSVTPRKSERLSWFHWIQIVFEQSFYIVVSRSDDVVAYGF